MPSSAEDHPPYTRSEAQQQDVFTDGLAGQQLQGQFHIYPNPASQSVNVSLDVLSRSGRCVLVLTDQLGKEHYRKEISQPLTSIPLSHLADGLYYVILHRNGQRDVVKIVKESDGGWSR